MGVGRAFDSIEKVNYRNWNLSYGGGFRIAWNQATVIMLDYGLSAEDGNFYLNFSHIF